MLKSMLSLTTLVLFVFAVGCATTGDQNYMGPVDPDQDIHGGDRPGEVKADVAPSVVLATNDVAVAVVEAVDDPPSLTGVDRSQWETVTVSPADGTVEHGRLFFRDRPSDHGVLVVDAAGPITDRIAAAMDRGYAVGWDMTNAKDAAIQPAKFALDLVLVPWHLFVPAEGDDGTTP